MTEHQDRTMIAGLPMARLPRLRAAFEVCSRGDQEQVPMHAHETTELVLVVEGHLQFGVAVTELDGWPGTLHVLPARIPHDQRCQAAWRTQCLLFDQAETLIDQSPRTLNLGGDPQTRRWVEDLCRLPFLPAFGEAQEALIGDGLLLALLGRIAQAERRQRTHQEMHPGLAVAVRYLADHFAADVSEHVLADVACVSGSHLRALFHQRCGCGPHQYQQRLRLEAARALLRNPYLSIEEVARQCGYEDANYFSRLFRRVTGCRPSQWRKTTH